MNTVLTRLNSVAFSSIAILIAMGVFAGVSVMYASPNPPITAAVSNVKLIGYHKGQFVDYNRANLFNLKFDLFCDLRGIFTWDVRQLFVWITVDYLTHGDIPGSVDTHQITIWDYIVE